jgi:hypothetical protein
MKITFAFVRYAMRHALCPMLFSKLMEWFFSKGCPALILHCGYWDANFGFRLEPESFRSSPITAFYLPTFGSACVKPANLP